MIHQLPLPWTPNFGSFVLCLGVCAHLKLSKSLHGRSFFSILHFHLLWVLKGAFALFFLSFTPVIIWNSLCGYLLALDKVLKHWPVPRLCFCCLCWVAAGLLSHRTRRQALSCLNWPRLQAGETQSSWTSQGMHLYSTLRTSWLISKTIPKEIFFFAFLELHRKK